MWVMVSKRWCSFSSGRGRSDGLPSRSFKMLCELRSVAQQAFRGGGALAGSVMLGSVMVMAFKQWQGYSFSSGEGGLLTASPRHDHSRASVGRAQWRSRAADRLRAVYRRVVESSGGATASAVARAAWAAPPRHAHSRASVGRARGRSRAAERSRAVRRRVVDGFQAVVVWLRQWRGRPRRPLLAALGRGIQCAALGGAARA